MEFAAQGLEGTLADKRRAAARVRNSKLIEVSLKRPTFEKKIRKLYGCPIWMGWISKLYYREAMYILELSKAPFLMIRAYILFFEEIFNF